MSEEATSASFEELVRGGGGFVSRFVHNLDPKRRLTIPSVWRAQLGAPPMVYVLPGFEEKCLRVLSVAEMARRIEKMRKYAVSDSKARQFARALASRSDLVPWDTQGRIRIKDELLEYAGLTEQVIMLSALDSFELWSPANHRGDLPDEEVLDLARYLGF